MDNKLSTKKILKKAYSEGGKNYESKNNDFIILTKTKKTIEYIIKIISNFPQKNINLTKRIENTCFDLLQNLHYYVVNSNNETYKKNT